MLRIEAKITSLKEKDLQCTSVISVQQLTFILHCVSKNGTRFLLTITKSNVDRF